MIFLKNPGDTYDQSDHPGYLYGHGHGHVHHLHGRTEHLTQDWDTHQGQNYQYESGDYVYSSTGTAESNGTNNFSVEEDYEQQAYPHTGHHSGADGQDYGEYDNVGHHFQVHTYLIPLLLYTYIYIIHYLIILNETFL